MVTAHKCVSIRDAVSAPVACMIANVIQCPEYLADCRDLYFGIEEPTPERVIGHKWMTDERSEHRQRLCAFLCRGGFDVEESDGWVTLCRGRGNFEQPGEGNV